VFVHNRIRHRAHRFSWERHHGQIPGGLFVLHDCDNPPCCNPDHLFFGTDQDNMADRQSKQRQPLGERNGRAVITEQKVLEIRALHKTRTLSLSNLAAKFAISEPTLQHIVYKQTWKHI